MTDDELNKCCTEVARQIVLEAYDKCKIDTDLKLSIAVCDLSLFMYTKIRAYKAAAKHKQALEQKIRLNMMDLLHECMGDKFNFNVYYWVDYTRDDFKKIFAALRQNLNNLHEINKNPDLKQNDKECENGCCSCDRCGCECEVDD